MVLTAEFDAEVDAAAQNDDVVSIRRVTKEFALWKRGYTRQLVIYSAYACIQALIVSKHVTLRYLATDAALYSKAPILLAVAVKLPQTSHADSQRVVEIIEDRTDLTDREREDMLRCVVGMVYAN